jgi:hypothetical protein
MGRGQTAERLLTVLFADGVPEIFKELPALAKRQASCSIDLLSGQPQMYPVRRLGIMRGHRYFVAGKHCSTFGVNCLIGQANTEIETALPNAEPIEQPIYLSGLIETRSNQQNSYAAPAAILLRV